VTHGFGFAIESLVAILLLLTILYCVRLNRQLRLLKADEQTLKVTISELITATEIAERAVAGLKLTARECDQSLGERLRGAGELSGDLDRQLAAGEDLLRRLGGIVAAARPADDKPPAVVPDAKTVVAAAAAFAERARARVRGKAA
jgi:hypothetical protein